MNLKLPLKQSITLMLLMSLFLIPGEVMSSVPGSDDTGTDCPIEFTEVNPTIYQHWRMIAESDNMVQVSVQTLRCDVMGSAQVFIELFNEISDDQTVHFDLMITDPSTNESETHVVNLALTKSEIIKPDCNNNDHPALRINLPSNFDPATVEFSITFQP